MRKKWIGYCKEECVYSVLRDIEILSGIAKIKMKSGR